MEGGLPDKCQKQTYMVIIYRGREEISGPFLFSGLPFESYLAQAFSLLTVQLPTVIALIACMHNFYVGPVV